EPQPEMILIDRPEGRTRLRGTLAPVGRQRVLGDAERLDAEDALHGRRAISFLVGLQITLVPRDAELRMGHLDDDEVVARVRGQPRGFDLHDLIDLLVFYRHRRRCAWEAVLDRSRGRYHRERERLLRFRAPYPSEKRQKNGRQDAPDCPAARTPNRFHGYTPFLSCSVGQPQTR